VPCRGCILVVDDDADIRDALTTCFEDLGCTVVAAADGQDAHERLGRCPRPCFVLLDLNMPRVDGDGFVRLLGRDERFREVPVISMSAGADRLAPGAALSHVEKPFCLAALGGSIDRLCQDPGWLRRR
jgi:CheY-like chemotaxis protein